MVNNKILFTFTVAILSMKKAHKKIIKEVNLLQPLDIPEIKLLMKEDDCFGKEWNPQSNDCSVCASLEVCGIVTADNLTQRKKEMGKFLDEVYLDVNWDKLEKLIKKYEEGGTPMKVSALKDHVIKVTRSKDRELIVAMLKKFIKGNDKIYTKSGVIHYRV